MVFNDSFNGFNIGAYLPPAPHQISYVEVLTTDMTVFRPWEAVQT